MSKFSAKEEAKRNQEISEYLRAEKKRLEHVIKLLLLGTGESGKSTIAKQMKVLYMNGFTDEERAQYKSVIFKNLFENMKALLTAAEEFGLPFDKDLATLVKKHTALERPSKDEADAITALWKSEGITKTYERRNEFQLSDSAQYYFENVHRLSDPAYVPSTEDLLRSRQMTTGVVETEFALEKATFILVDVGGQRSERKKWIHVFQDVTAVIFVVSLSEYDLKLAEDHATNRMEESLKVFKDICNNKAFVNTNMILFLNKSDIFREKIKKSDLSKTFPDYNGGANFEKATEFVKNLYVAQNDNNKKHVYTHITCATDKENINVVFNAVKDIILHRVLDESGLGIN